jgi:DNA-binding SARP family transcriptional activator
MGHHGAVGATTIQLLGRPCIRRGTADVYKFRSRKSWALLAYLILRERPPTRSQLASLLFADANDPVRALRWSLTEIRRAMDEDGSLDGDPVVLQRRRPFCTRRPSDQCRAVRSTRPSATRSAPPR